MPMPCPEPRQPLHTTLTLTLEALKAVMFDFNKADCEPLIWLLASLLVVSTLKSLLAIIMSGVKGRLMREGTGGGNNNDHNDHDNHDYYYNHGDNHNHNCNLTSNGSSSSLGPSNSRPSNSGSPLSCSR